MRLIDADALKRKILATTFTESNMWALNLLIGLIDAEPTIGGWISVKDRLPDDPPWAAKWVAVWFGESSEIHTEAPLLGKYNPADETWWVLGNTLGKPGDRMKITHWMLLPEPPKEVSRDE